MPDEKAPNGALGQVREVILKVGEVSESKTEPISSPWANPLVLAILAATVGLIGNTIVTILNNHSTQQTEHLHAQSALILEAIKTNGDTAAACKNLNFFVNLGLLDDANKTIIGACPNTKNQGVPTLPANVSGESLRSPNLLRIIVSDDNGNGIPGAVVHLEDGIGNSDNCGTTMTGLCVLPPLPIGDTVHIEARKEGYRTTVTNVEWSGGGFIHVVLVK
jgi:hypothetical protein